MSGFFQSPVCHVHWPEDGSSAVLAVLPDGQELRISYSTAVKLFNPVQDPPNMFEGWDFVVPPNQTLTMTANQVSGIQHAQSLEEAKASLDEALTAREEAQYPGMTLEPQSGLGESIAPAVSGSEQNVAASSTSQPDPGTETPNPTSDSLPSSLPGMMAPEETALPGESLALSEQNPVTSEESGSGGVVGNQVDQVSL